MADSSNALLDSIANPKQVDIGADYGTANRLAAGIWANRLSQSQQAAGQAFQDSIGADGTPNQTQLMQNLKAAGPGAALSAQTAAQSGQSLDNSTFTTQMTRVGMMTNANLQLLTDYNGAPPLDAIKKNIENHAKQFGFTPDQVAQAESQFSDDATKNGQVMLQNSAAGLNHLQALQAARPGTGTVDNGQTIQGTQTAPLLSSGQTQGAVTPVGPGVTKQPGPEFGNMSLDKRNELVTIVDPDRTLPNGQPNPNFNQSKSIRREDALKQLGITLPPLAQPNRAALLNGPKGNVGAFDGIKPAPGLLMDPDMAGQTEGPPGSSATPVPQQQQPTPSLTTGVAPGQAAAASLDLGAFDKARTAQPQLQAQDQNLQHAYDALKLITTGKTTETMSAMKNILAANGMLPQGVVNDQVLYEIFNKYTERTIAAAGNAGGTDTARAMAAGSNPGTPLLSQSNLAFLRNDIGKNRQAMLPLLTAPDTATGTGFANHQSGMSDPTKIDYRGLNWSQYSPAEQAEITKSVGPVGSPRELALQRAKGMGSHFWPETGPVSAVPHASIATPPGNRMAINQPAPRQNMLAMG